MPPGNPKDFLLFSEVTDDLAPEDPSLARPALWTPEITLYNCNLLVEEFLASREPRIPPFYPSFVNQLHNGHRKARVRYTLRLFQSLSQFAGAHQAAGLYMTLFSTQTDAPVYNLFWQTRGLILELKGELKSHNADLDVIFLGERQWQYVLRCIFNFSLEQIQEFEAEMVAAVLDLKRDRKTRTRLYKYCRNEEYCASFFLTHTMNKFYQIYQESLVRSVQSRVSIDKGSGEFFPTSKVDSRSNSQKILVVNSTPSLNTDRRDSQISHRRMEVRTANDSGGSGKAIPDQSSFRDSDSQRTPGAILRAQMREAARNKVSEIIQKANEMADHSLPPSEDNAVRVEIFRSKLTEKDRLIEQIRDLTRERTAYQASAARLVATLEKTDEIVSNLKGILTSLHSNLAGFAPAPSPTNDHSTDFLLPDNDVAKLVTTNAAATKRAVRKIGRPVYEDLKEKVADMKPKVDGLATRIKRIVFDRNYTLYPQAYDFEVEEFWTEAQNQFGHKTELDDASLLILNTFINNVPRDPRHHGVSLHLGSAFEHVSDNMAATIDGLLAAQLSEKETENIEEFQTFNVQTPIDGMQSIDLNSGSHQLQNGRVRSHTHEPDISHLKVDTKGIHTPPDPPRKSLKERYAFLRDPEFDLMKFNRQQGVSNRTRTSKHKGEKLSKTETNQPIDWDMKGSISEKKMSMNEPGSMPSKGRLPADEILRTFAGTNNTTPVSFDSSRRKVESERITAEQALMGMEIVREPGFDTPAVSPNPDAFAAVKLNIFVPSDKIMEANRVSDEDGFSALSVKVSKDRKDGENVPADDLSFGSRDDGAIDDRKVSRAMDVKAKKQSIGESLRSGVVDEKVFQMNQNSLRNTEEEDEKHKSSRRQTKKSEARSPLGSQNSAVPATQPRVSFGAGSAIQVPSGEATSQPQVLSHRDVAGEASEQPKSEPKLEVKVEPDLGYEELVSGPEAFDFS